MVLFLGGYLHLLGSGSVVVAEVLVRILWMTVKGGSVDEGKVLMAVVVKGIVSGF